MPGSTILVPPHDQTHHQGQHVCDLRRTTAASRLHLPPPHCPKDKVHPSPLAEMHLAWGRAPQALRDAGDVQPLKEGRKTVVGTQEKGGCLVTWQGGWLGGCWHRNFGRTLSYAGPQDPDPTRETLLWEALWGGALNILQVLGWLAGGNAPKVACAQWLFIFGLA